MGTDHSTSPTRLGEYLTLLLQRDADGHPFVIVGGHGANFWAEFYSEREPRLQALLPFVSKDLDLIGTKTEATRVAASIGWHVSPPPVGGGPVQAVVSSKLSGEGLTVEFLTEIKGVSHDTILDNTREGIVRVPGTGQSVVVRVLDPVFLLIGKVRNVVDIQQDSPARPRQDVKHVAMLALCVPHFLEDVRAQTIGQVEQDNICGRYITILAALKNGYSGRQFEARHPAIVHWEALIPQSIQHMSFKEEIRASLRHVVGRGQSRGIGI